MTIRKVKDITLYKDAHFYASFPSVVTLPDGDLLTIFRRAPDHRWLVSDNDLPLKEDFNNIDHVHARSHLAMLRLSPELKARAPVSILPIDPEAGDQDGNLLLLKDGRLLQYGFLWYPVLPEFYDRLVEGGANPIRDEKHWGVDYLFWGSYVRFSDDEGEHWSDRVMLPVHPSAEGNKVVAKAKRGGPLRGRAIETGEGKILLSVYIGGINEHSEELGHLYQSLDRGESWSVKGNVIRMPDVHLREPSLATWPDSKNIIAFFRTKGLEDDHLVTAKSCDGGDSFSNFTEHKVLGHPYDPLVLPDGRLFLVYGYRHEPYGVRARIIEEGTKIEDAPEIIIRDDIVGRDVGYPWATMMQDGRLFVAYYVTYDDGLRGIDASILELD